jgi:hypothetical protein
MSSYTGQNNDRHFVLSIYFHVDSVSVVASLLEDKWQKLWAGNIVTGASEMYTAGSLQHAEYL